MYENKSPWLHQLNITREINTLKKDIETDVVIIGAGIAGVSTAFFTLQNTDKKVVLLDADKVAHGATGHNAGQATSYFERELHELVSVFGLEKTIAGQKAIEEDAWKLLDEMYTKAGLDVPMSRFVGFTGITEHAHVLEALENNRYRKEGGINLERLLISDDAPYLEKIDKEKYNGLFEVIPKSELLSSLETQNLDYTAMLASQKGCFNSALLSNEIVSFLMKNYPDRFELFEKTPVYKIILKENSALLDAGKNVLSTQKVVLCTNGFESVQIITADGLDINRKFHTNLQGYVGYMSAYFETLNKKPTALGYFEKGDKKLGDDDMEYFYLTRRPFDGENKAEHNLITIGGPGHLIDHHHLYDKGMSYPHEKIMEIDDFVKKNYDPDPNKTIDYQFTWHGLMGFTKNRVRMIGPDQKSSVLLFKI